MTLPNADDPRGEQGGLDRPETASAGGNHVDKPTPESAPEGKASITCPNCHYQWFRRFTIQEEITAFSRKPTLKGMLYILNKRCALCGNKFNSPDEATLDHILPKSRGGKNHWSNYQLAHKQCNRNKGNKILPVSDFLEGEGEHL